MTHILDNPIWNALLSGSKHLAISGKQARYLKRDVGPFAGLQNNSEADLKELLDLIPDNGPVVLFTPAEISIPAGWRVEFKKELLQMVYAPQDLPFFQENRLVSLQDQHIDAMLALTAMTRPGPFLSRTIDFGNYEGVFAGNQLAAMTGQRLQPDPYTEVSAVCTHPDHTGKGYAASLIKSQIRKITAESRIPFLHVYPDNTAACKLYEKLGFQTRKQMMVTFMKKEI